LPPGPINNPGKDAILAALYPEEHKYIFFIADGKAGHKFSESYSEHLKEVREYRNWLKSQKKYLVYLFLNLNFDFTVYEMRLKTKTFNQLIFLVFFFIASCANQLPPGGSEVDRIPPKIVEVFPADGTTNFDEDYFEIGFSEYVDKRSVQDAIFISPAIEGEIEYDWSGKYLRVNFSQKLKDNTTYVVTIGTDVADLNNKNRMSEAFIFTFSTGNEIDRR